MPKGWKFEDNSKQTKQQMDQVSEEALLSAALLVEGHAKALAAVSTGELRDRIDHRITTRGIEKVAQVGSPNKHAIYVEFGTGEFAENGAGRKGGWVYKAPDGKWYFTRGQSPQPFLRPAFRRNKDKIKEIIGKEYGARFDGK
ncbi:hypothetical protein CHCC20442_4311 [Bacillus licheniformis]|uniref:HK97-gp10 family putative phage morphogenesis protein n=1 Tax=Bacillus licheniformis TaxID=1402 RepID=UPI00119CB54C|nr:HK97-gp10 family putative phage morphogenesis protein [Bacillus licheniformis]TWK08598.1 hypothetical protein CHCC20442_4311 [Bacillus licheniformis]